MCEVRLNFFTKTCFMNNYFSRDPHFVILAWVQSWNIFEKLMKVCSPPETTHCLAAMSIKDHLIKLTMWWQGAQKLRNDRPVGAANPPAPPSVSPLAKHLIEHQIQVVIVRFLCYMWNDIVATSFQDHRKNSSLISLACYKFVIACLWHQP